MVTEYQTSFADVAYSILSGRALQSTIHVCSELHCTTTTFDLWYTDHEDFRNAVDMGMIEGEKKFRDSLRKVSLHNASRVNTKLLLELAANVYNWSTSDADQDSTYDPNNSTEILDTMTEKEAAFIYTNMINGTTEK